MLALALTLMLAKPAPHFAVLKRFTIGGEGGWDDLTYEASSGRLFVSRGTHVMVVDVEAGKVVGDIPDTPGVHGIAIADGTGKGYISNGRDNTVTVFELSSLKTLKRVPVGTKPDIILFDTASSRIFCFNGGSNDATAIEVRTDSVAGTVKLDGKPEFAKADGNGNLFVNIEDKSEIQRIDTRNLKAAGSWPVAPGEEPTGLAFDVKNHLLYSACANNMIVVSDARSMKVLGTAPIGSGPDGAGFDRGLGLAFTSNGQDGTLSVVGRAPDGRWTTIETVPTQQSARTMAIDPKAHRIYLIAAEYTAATTGQSRRTMVPGSAAILVVGIK